MSAPPAGPPASPLGLLEPAAASSVARTDTTTTCSLDGQSQAAKSDSALDSDSEQQQEQQEEQLEQPEQPEQPEQEERQVQHPRPDALHALRALPPAPFAPAPGGINPGTDDAASLLGSRQEDGIEDDPLILPGGTRMTPYLVRLALIACLSGLQFGMDVSAHACMPLVSR